MLVIARKTGESVVANPDSENPITITVKANFGNVVGIRVVSKSGISYAFRYVNQVVLVGEIKINVNRFEGTRLVYLGFEAPKEIKILREELLKKTTEDTENTEGDLLNEFRIRKGPTSEAMSPKFEAEK